MKRFTQGLVLMALLLVVAACGAAGQATAAPVTLTGVKWRLMEMRTGGQATPISQPDRYTVTFSSQGRLNYKADCNTGEGTYRQSGSQLSIVLQPLALQNCGPDSLSLAYYQSLNDVATYAIKDESLHLYLAQDGGELTHGK
jgi:heat shock protein HslJ